MKELIKRDSQINYIVYKNNSLSLTHIYTYIFIYLII